MSHNKKSKKGSVVYSLVANLVPTPTVVSMRHEARFPSGKKQSTRKRRRGGRGNKS